MEGHIQVQGQPIYGQNQHGGATPGGRGQGEAVPVPPIPRRRLSKVRNTGDESSSGQTDTSECQTTTTIHVTSIGVENELCQEQRQQQRHENRHSSRENSHSGKSWTKMFFCSSAAFLFCFIVVGMTLDYFDLWDPCVIHIPYEKHCTTDSYVGGLFYRTDYTEESLCLIPGVFYSTKTTGWNTDGICSNDQIVSTSSPSPSTCIGTGTGESS